MRRIDALQACICCSERNERLISVILKCIDPSRVSEAVAGFWVGCVAVLACLKSAIAQCLAIGADIGAKACKLFFHSHLA